MFINIRLWFSSLKGLIEAFRLSVPIGVSLFCHIASFITNSIILAHINTTYSAAYSLATSIWHMTFMFMYGVSIYLSRHVVNVCCLSLEGSSISNSSLQEASSLVLFFSFWGSVFCTAFVFFLSFLIIPNIVAAELLPSVQNYLLLMCFGMPGIIFSTFAKSVLDGIHKTYYAMYLAIIMYIINISGSLFLVFYATPPSEFGVVYAMVLSWWGIGILSYVYMRYEGLMEHWSFSVCLWASKHAYNVLFGGLMVASSLLVDTIFLHSISFYMSSYEPTLVTAHYMLLHINSLLFVLFPLGLSVGVSIYATSLVAKGQWKELLIFMRMSISCIIFLELVVISLVYLFKKYIFSAYSPDMQIINIAIQYVPFLCLLIILDSLNVIIVGLLRALDDTKFPAIAYFIGYICIGGATFYTCLQLPFTLFMVSWITIVIGLFSLTILLAIRLWFMMRYIKYNYIEGVGIALFHPSTPIH